MMPLCSEVRFALGTTRGSTSGWLAMLAVVGELGGCVKLDG
jgi:hypothetical protein